MIGLDIRKAAKVIKAGGLVVFPSDTVYILAVDPTNKTAVEKLLGFKNRWTGKAISIAVLDKKMAEGYVSLNDNGESIYANLLPGPFTVVSNGLHKVAAGIEAENGTLGIRIPDNKWIMDLVKEVGGPVTATSANLSGRTPHYSVESFKKTLSKKKLTMIDLIVDAGKLPRNKPSTVIDATESDIKILRRGDLIVGKSQVLISKSERETEKIGEFILGKVKSQKSKNKTIVFGLSGDLGCGKTVFSRKIGHLLGVKEKIVSPTFVIYNQYEITKKQKTSNPNNGQLPNSKFQTFLHFDLYRLKDKYEFEEIKFLEQFPSTLRQVADRSGLVACIEWPENMGEEYLAKLKERVNYVPVNFSYVDEKTREIRF